MDWRHQMVVDLAEASPELCAAVAEERIQWVVWANGCSSPSATP